MYVYQTALSFVNCYKIFLILTDVLLKMLKQERKLVAEREGLLKEHGIQWSRRTQSPTLGRTSPLSERNSLLSTSTTLTGSLATPSGLTTPSTTASIPRVTTATPLNETRTQVRAGKSLIYHI